MQASADLDILVHFGYFKNIDLLSRGAYFIRLYLTYGDEKKKLVPIGLFSAPSTLDSFVRDQPVSPMRRDLHMSHVDEDAECFLSRSFVVRFKDEQVELNDAAYYRLSMRNLPEAELCMFVPVQIKCELIHSPARRRVSTQYPESKRNETDQGFGAASYHVVASTCLTINKIKNTMHEYYPITFDKYHFCQLDVMVHCAFTSLKYNEISLTAIPARANTTSQRRPKRTTAETVSETFTDVIERLLSPSPNHSQIESKRPNSGSSAESSANSSTGIGEDEILVADVLDSLSAYPDAALGVASSVRDVTGSGLPTHQLMALFDRYVGPLDRNLGAIARSVQWLWDHVLPQDIRMSFMQDITVPLQDVIQRNSADQHSQALNLDRSSDLVSTASGCTSETAFEEPDSQRLPSARNLILRHSLSQSSQREQMLQLLFGAPDMQTVKDIINDCVATLSRQCSVDWSQMTSTMARCMPELQCALRSRWLVIMKRYWRGHMLVNTQRMQTFLKPEPDIYEEHSARASLMRSQIRNGDVIMPALPLFDPDFMGDVSQIPIVFLQQFGTYTEVEEMGEGMACARAGKLLHVIDDDYLAQADIVVEGLSEVAMCPALSSPNSPTPLGSSQRSPHESFLNLYVLMHGYQGSSYDMRMFKNHIQVLFPHAYVLCSKSSENNTDRSIALMGTALAQEVREWIDMRHHDFFSSPHNRISFIGHSVGGVVVRAALTHEALVPVIPHIHTYISLSSPHVGTLFATSQLIKTGMWALWKLKKSPLLQELMLEDGSTPEESYLYTLSTASGLRGFKHVIFVSAHQDTYVPIHSARVQISSIAETDSSMGPVLISMVAGIMSAVHPSAVIRLNLDARFARTSVDTIIGRAAHIWYLENPLVSFQILFSVYHYLR